MAEPARQAIVRVMLPYKDILQAFPDKEEVFTHKHSVEEITKEKAQASKVWNKYYLFTFVAAVLIGACLYQLMTNGFNFANHYNLGASVLGGVALVAIFATGIYINSVVNAIKKQKDAEIEQKRLERELERNAAVSVLREMSDYLHLDTPEHRTRIIELFNALPDDQAFSLIDEMIARYCVSGNNLTNSERRLLTLFIQNITESKARATISNSIQTEFIARALPFSSITKEQITELFANIAKHDSIRSVSLLKVLDAINQLYIQGGPQRLSAEVLEFHKTLCHGPTLVYLVNNDRHGMVLRILERSAELDLTEVVNSVLQTASPEKAAAFLLNIYRGYQLGTKDFTQLADSEKGVIFYLNPKLEALIGQRKIPTIGQFLESFVSNAAILAQMFHRLHGDEITRMLNEVQNLKYPSPEQIQFIALLLKYSITSNAHIQPKAFLNKLMNDWYKGKLSKEIVALINLLDERSAIEIIKVLKPVIPEILLSCEKQYIADGKFTDGMKVFARCPRAVAERTLTIAISSSEMKKIPLNELDLSHQMIIKLYQNMTPINKKTFESAANPAFFGFMKINNFYETRRE